MKIIQYLLSTLLLLSVTTACQSTLKEFQPKNDSLFKITFSYPASWNWYEDIPFDEPPLDVELPPSERFVVENGSLEEGSISIQVYLTPAPHTEAREWIDEFSSSDSPFTVLDDNTLQIDGHEARWLTLSSVAWSAQGNIDAYDEIVYLFTEDRYYTIGLSELESEIDRRVHKEFEKLVQSIRVLK
ncbi:MAG: hypothetical protein U0X74_02000 [Anaerolineales bacterium]